MERSVGGTRSSCSSAEIGNDLQVFWEDSKMPNVLFPVTFTQGVRDFVYELSPVRPLDKWDMLVEFNQPVKYEEKRIILNILWRSFADMMDESRGELVRGCGNSAVAWSDDLVVLHYHFAPGPDGSIERLERPIYAILTALNTTIPIKRVVLFFSDYNRKDLCHPFRGWY